MNVKAALTTDSGEDVKTPRRFFISEDYRNRVNILPIRNDKFLNYGKNPRHLLSNARKFAGQARPLGASHLQQQPFPGRLAAA